MNLTTNTIVQAYFHRFHVEISMAAFSRTNPGRHSEQTPEFYRLWFVLEGGGSLTVNNREIVLKPGQMLLLPPGVRQTYKSDSSEWVGLYWCNFHVSIGEMCEVLQLPLYVVPQESEQLISLFEQLITAYRSTNLTRELRIRAGLFEILACYMDCAELSEASVREVELSERIQHVLTYIEDHLSDTIAVNELAKLAFLHPNYFIGYFKNSVGYAPLQYVNMRRLERAKMLLQQNIRISDVARQVGMQNHYLSRQFKYYTGLTPSRYRQIYKTTMQDDSNDVAARRMEEA